MIIFNGSELATKREKLLKERIFKEFPNKKLKIAAILFVEDVGSKLYTNLKYEAATRVGIEYETHEFSLKNISESKEGTLGYNKVVAKIKELNKDSSVTGVIIQKPWRKTWIKAQGVVQKKFALEGTSEREQYTSWWTGLTSEISEKKDVDGLHPNTIAQIKAGTWQENKKVLPATCRAVLSILDRAGELKAFSDKKIIIIGKSDLLGVPLYYELLRRSGELKTEEDKQSLSVELIASKEFKKRMLDGRKLLDAGVIVSATGIKGLITGDIIAENSVVIDVGEPAADVDFESVASKVAFITPVPGGVGPMTVISLLENCADLAQ